MGLFPEAKLRGPLGQAALMAKAMIRRAVVAASANGLWNLEGFADEIDADVPVFSGVGFYSRPRSAVNSDAECVVVKIGGKTAHPVIVATRDERLRQAITAARDLAEDETIIFNSTGALVHIKADGDIEIQPKAGGRVHVRSAGGTDDDLITKTEFLRHTHVTAGTGAPVTPTPISGGPLLFTTVIKAE